MPTAPFIVGVLDGIRRDFGISAAQLSKRVGRVRGWWALKLGGTTTLSLRAFLNVCQALGVRASDVLALAEHVAHGDDEDAAETMAEIRRTRVVVE